MLGGPVLAFELVRVPRRRRFFLLRFGLGLLLLGVVGLNYGIFQSGLWELDAGNTGELSLHELAWFSRSLFVSVMFVQTTLILGLAPALVSDAIASERHRKTLHYLLSSRLSGAEIVLGKLGARLIDLMALLGVSLPIVSLLTLIGGVDPKELLWIYASLGACTLFAGAMAIWASVEARRPRDAVGLSYFLMMVWLGLPAFIGTILNLFPKLWTKVEPAFTFFVGRIWPASPLSIVEAMSSNTVSASDALQEAAAWLVFSLSLYATFFCALAAWRLRPAFRALDGRSGRVRTAKSPVPISRETLSCGNDPIYWKETAFLKLRGGLLRKLQRLGGCLLLGCVIIGPTFGAGLALGEVISQGYAYQGYSSYSQRQSFNSVLRSHGGFLFVVWLLWLGQTSGAMFTTEREQDTWISLLSTPLESREILRGKMLGALRTTAPMAIVLGGMWLAGLVLGAVHPLGFVAAALLVLLYAWFVVTVGTFFSLRCTATWRAQAWTLLAVLVPNVFCCMISPAMSVVIALASYQDIAEFLSSNNDALGFLRSVFGVSLVLLAVISIVGHALVACSITRSLPAKFDEVADRPRRMRRGLIPKHSAPTTYPGRSERK